MNEPLFEVVSPDATVIEHHTFKNASDLVRNAGWIFGEVTPADVSPVVLKEEEEEKKITKEEEVKTPATAKEKIVDPYEGVSREDLVAAAKNFGIEIDGRASNKRVITQIEVALLLRLAASGDTTEDDSSVLRAYKLAVEALEAPEWTPENPSIKSIIEGVAAL